jgi:hypothetical protein
VCYKLFERLISSAYFHPTYRGVCITSGAGWVPPRS